MSANRSAVVLSVLAALLTITLRAEAQVDAKASSRIFGHSYVDGVHHAWGKIRIWLPEGSHPRQVRARCHIYVIWSGRGRDRYTDQRTTEAHVRTPVSIFNPKARRFWVMLPDSSHQQVNNPGRWDTGCR